MFIFVFKLKYGASELDLKEYAHTVCHRACAEVFEHLSVVVIFSNVLAMGDVDTVAGDDDYSIVNHSDHIKNSVVDDRKLYIGILLIGKNLKRIVGCKSIVIDGGGGRMCN